MARMSIDDMVGRDSRFDHLAALCGWSRRETVGCMHDVWAINYDRVAPYLDADEIERTALRGAISSPLHAGGFIGALLESKLGRPATAKDRHYIKKDGTKVPFRDQHWQGRICISGARERVGYQLVTSEAGRRGGVKSGEVRRKSAKQPFNDPSTTLEGCTNPSSSALSSASLSIPDSASALASAQTGPERASGDPRADLQRSVLFSVFKQHFALFNEIRAELGLEIPPMQPLGDPAERALLALLKAQVTLEGFEGSARHVLAVRAAEARRERTLKFFGQSVWSPDSFGIARSMEVGEVRNSPRNTNQKQGSSPQVGRVEPMEPNAYPNGEVQL